MLFPSPHEEPHLLGRRTPGYRSRHKEDVAMPESVYKIIELVGTSTDSWEKAAAAAVSKASKTLRDLRIAEVSELDLQIENGKVKAYRAKLKVSFKYED
jgi:flavin-binding protein dodecin